MVEISQLFPIIPNYLQYCFFYFFGFFIFYLLDIYIFPKNDMEEKIYVIQESEQEIIKINKKKYKNEISQMPSINKFYIVIGLGGVGSKVVMNLIRAGVKKIKVIDYDLVTLSSLNRHSFAKRTDVGKFKADLIKEYCIEARPDIIIESIDEPLLENNMENILLKEKPDVIIDCIDDLNTKAELYIFCYLKKLKLFSSMGAAGKCDPTTIRYSKFDEIRGDILSKRLRNLIRKKMKEKFGFDFLPNFDCVYSFAKIERDLAELDEEKKQNIEQIKINFNERIRSLPVFACMPSSFGHCLSALSIQKNEDS